eukprot:scaffold5442_cov223-Pinguiococcus_pyrenoidosus.AAC.2
MAEEASAALLASGFPEMWRFASCAPRGVVCYAPFCSRRQFRCCKRTRVGDLLWAAQGPSQSLLHATLPRQGADFSPLDFDTRHRRHRTRGPWFFSLGPRTGLVGGGRPDALLG